MERMVVMKRLFVFLAIAAIFLMGTMPASAEETLRKATIKQLEGSAQVKLAGQEWQTAQIGMTLKQNDSIKTGDASWMLLQIDDGEGMSSVEIAKNSQLEIAILTKDAASGSRQTLLDLAIGEVVVQAQKLYDPKSKFEVKTPTSIAGARGTRFSVKVEAAQ